MPLTDEELDRFARGYADWAMGIEQQARQKGHALSPRMIEIAREMGLRHADSLRILIVEEIPFPHEDDFLHAIGLRLGLIGPGIVGNAQVFGEMVLSRAEFANSIPKMAHELMHVRQVQEVGGFEPFLRKYLREVLTHGYHQAPYEIEAYAINDRYAETGDALANP
jgi:hypothetical protein